MRVAVATDDLKTVRLGHFGEARYYEIYELDGQETQLVERRRNIYADWEEHGSHGKRRKIIELLKDCDVVISTFFGPKGPEDMRRSGKTPITVKPGTSIREALEAARKLLKGQ